MLPPDDHLGKAKSLQVIANAFRDMPPMVCELYPEGIRASSQRSSVNSIPLRPGSSGLPPMVYPGGAGRITYGHAKRLCVTYGIIRLHAPRHVHRYCLDFQLALIHTSLCITGSPRSLWLPTHAIITHNTPCAATLIQACKSYPVDAENPSANFGWQ